MQPRPRPPLASAVAPAVAVARRTQARVARHVGPVRSLALLLATALVLALAATAATAELYEAVTEGDGVAVLDRPVSRLVAVLRTPGLDGWVTRFTDLGGPVVLPWLTLAATLLVYLVVPLLHRRWLRTAAIAVGLAFAVAMGLSRVYLGHHWFTDVLVAWTLGTGWLAVVVVADQLVSWRGRDRTGASTAA